MFAEETVLQIGLLVLMCVAILLYRLGRSNVRSEERRVGKECRL